jgi:predicted ATPase/DNA-binding CsgD family transcriptional regulator
MPTALVGNAAQPTHRHNLPSQRTGLIGRAREVLAVRNLLRRDDVSLVTLTGPGGTGKTRLGLQVATELLDDLANGVWFVNLAPISDPNLVAATVAQTLGIKESAGRALLDSLKDYLAEKQILLLLDNFEQVVDAAPLLSELLVAAPGLKVLTTSRTRLHLSGEHEIAVPPLSLPPLTKATQTTERTVVGMAITRKPSMFSMTAVAELTQYDAVRLFIERAQAVKADFAVTNESAPAVAEICYRLDGLPLAIELAAARVKLFSPQALLARLRRVQGSRLQLLTGGARDLPARQQTIRNTIDWSCQLLDVGEQRLFARLGVFAGGCTLEAIDAVCIGEDGLPIDVTDGVASLLDKSLVRQEEGSDGEPRITMLQTIREYARERLELSGEAEVVRQRHAHYFLALAEEAEPWIRFMRPERDPWLERLNTEQDNLRAAQERFDEREETELCFRLAWALRIFWQKRFNWSEDRAWLEAALTKSDNTPGAARAKALVTAAALAHCMGDFAAWQIYIEEALELLRGLGDKAAIAMALLSLGTLLQHKGEYAAARTCAEESLALFHEVSDQWGRAYALLLFAAIAALQGDLAQAAVSSEELLTIYRRIGYKRGIGLCLNDKGVLAQLQGDWERAKEFFAESLAIFREVGDKEKTVMGLHNLGCAVLHQGDEPRAGVCFAEGLALSREIGSRYSIATHLAGMAGMAAQGHPERSARLFGAAETMLDSLGIVVEPMDRAEYDRNAAVARNQLGADAFAAAWEAGRAMTPEQAIEDALAFVSGLELSAAMVPIASSRTVATNLFPAGLTAREVDVLRLVAQGLPDTQIAERLVVSPHTVHAHLRSIYGKLEITSRAAATRFAVDHHLV